MLKKTNFTMHTKIVMQKKSLETIAREKIRLLNTLLQNTKQRIRKPCVEKRGQINTSSAPQAEKLTQKNPCNALTNDKEENIDKNKEEVKEKKEKSKVRTLLKEQNDSYNVNAVTMKAFTEERRQVQCNDQRRKEIEHCTLKITQKVLMHEIQKENHQNKTLLFRLHMT